MHTLGLRVAEKLALAGIKISLIELNSCGFRQKLALPELKKAELRSTLYVQEPGGASSGCSRRGHNTSPHARERGTGTHPRPRAHPAGAARHPCLAAYSSTGFFGPN